MKVFIIQRQFPSYRKHIFDRLAAEWDLKVLHGPPEFAIKGTQAEYAHKVRYLRPIRKKNLIFLFCSLRILTNRPHLVIHESGIGILSMWMTILTCRIVKCKFMLWGHGYNMKLGFDPDSSWESRIRSWSMKLSDGYLCYSDEGKRLLSQYMDETRVFVAQNSTNVESMLKIKQRLTQEKDSSTKDTQTKYHLAYQGRLIPEKNPHLLLDLYDYLKKRLEKDLIIHVIGGGPLLEELKTMALASNRNVKFHGAMYDPLEFGPILLKCSLMVNPGYIGLSILDGFCFDLPVVTFEQKANGPFHSPEISYLQHKKTGFLVKDHTVEAMGDCIVDFLNKNQQEKMLKEIEHLLQRVNSQKMSAGFLEAAQITVK